MNPVDCEHVLDQVWLYLDGEISEAEFQQIRGHIAECTDCGSRYEFQRRLLAIIEQKCKEGPMPEALKRRLFELLQGEPGT